MKKVLFYGDSNTYGYDPAGFMGGRYPRQQRWTGILAERLAGEWEIAADGMPGRMIPGNAYSIEIALDAVKADGPMDLFAVMLGTNDLLNQRHPYSPAVAARAAIMKTDSRMERSFFISVPPLLIDCGRLIPPPDGMDGLRKGSPRRGSAPPPVDPSADLSAPIISSGETKVNEKSGICLKKTPRECIKIH